MKKVLLLLLIGFMAIAPMAGAVGSVRTDGMGINPNQGEDLSLIWLFPQKINDYSVIDFNMGTQNKIFMLQPVNVNDEWGGMVHEDACIGNWGIYLGRPFHSKSINIDSAIGNVPGVIDFAVSYLLWDDAVGGSIGDYIDATGNQITGLGDALNIEHVVDTVMDLANAPYEVASTLTVMSPPRVSSIAGVLFAGTWDLMLTAAGPNLGFDIVDPDNKVDLFKTFAVGDGVLGLHVNYAAAGYNLETSGTDGDNDSTNPGDQLTSLTKGKSSVIGVDLGYGLDEVGPFAALDITAGYYMGSLDYENSSTTQNTADTGAYTDYQGTLEGDGISEIRIAARAVKEMSEDTDLLINAGAKIGKLAAEYTSKSTSGADEILANEAGELMVNTSEWKSTLIEAGVACNHDVNDGMGKVVVGLNFTHAKNTLAGTSLITSAASPTVANYINGLYPDVEIGYTGVWANVGVEANLLKWMVFRAGMDRGIIEKISAEIVQSGDPNADNTATTDTYTMEGSASGLAAIPLNLIRDFNGVNMTFGVGIMYKNWNVDMQMSKDAIQDLLGDGNLGEGLLYAGSVVNPVQIQVKYNL